ncbi:hypothetical protein E5676_scaffold607G00400 [Cucumis melo var. makuwa]|uniref:Uncharacterized protein n=1 Tax=Cucumis melo var. makuwa TaxID=1194695 RepID=A0A5D3D4L8_CUCMM|nr:hypothetical protein E6C27_scaffold121G001210 [Cucumis melo var. makuwa]TYK18470.1 hypothetical protein E5676_scaffold607G00400 [Cucumis melo var. makuwa]
MCHARHRSVSRKPPVSLHRTISQSCVRVRATSPATESILTRAVFAFPKCLSISPGYTKDQFVLDVPLGSPKTRDVPTGSQITRVREHASLGVEVEVRAKGSWRLTRSDRSEPYESFLLPPYVI